jgi:serine/threonine protein kinase
MQVLRAARAMHAVGLRHNDIHPANILMSDERTESVRLVDLGNATPIGAGFHGGSPWHAAPEQLNGGPTHDQVRTDVFSAGAVLAFLLTGRQPDPNKPQLRDLIPNVTAQVGGRGGDGSREGRRDGQPGSPAVGRHRGGRREGQPV